MGKTSKRAKKKGGSIAPPSARTDAGIETPQPVTLSTPPPSRESAPPSSAGASSRPSQSPKAEAKAPDAKPSQPPPSDSPAETSQQPKVEAKEPAGLEAQETPNAEGRTAQDAKPSQPPPADVADEKSEPVAHASATDERGSSPPVHIKSDSGEWQSFFAKPEHEIHEEHVLRETVDLDLDHPDVNHPRLRKVVDKRTRQIVAAIVGIVALIGAIGIARRVSLSRARARTAAAQVSQPVSPPAPVTPDVSPAPTPVASPPPVAPVPTAPPIDSAIAAASGSASAAPSTSASAAPSASTSPSAVASASAAPSASAGADDPDDKLSGTQLLGMARTAMSSGNSGRAVALARKAAKKGAGGSAYYIIGAGTGSKGAYEICAKSGCPEAAECASIAEGM